ncbi:MULTISPECIES: hypothetical protein [Amycolatopsis]|uniref:Uncharacterized protein n=2 Tax=Amycolatopsis TaxID=1813 RepID=A0A1I3NZP3_9PSEU|nr:hypothetical protein [Amycolatopsis sacchari]SFJ14552.1 hypothetical protein SAMN05421835_103212 [Amycolatopsis sacchari]
MTFDASAVAGLVVVVPLLVWALWAVLGPVVFRLVVLPAFARERGWRARGRFTGYEAEDELPGDGSQDWETPLPGMLCEFVGTHAGRPVHGVEVSVTYWLRRLPGQVPRRRVRYYSVVTMAVSDQPFSGFNAERRGRVLNGDPMAFYPDFVEWARNRKLLDTGDVVQSDAGMRSVSWFGHLSRRRLVRALDKLAEAAA